MLSKGLSTDITTGRPTGAPTDRNAAKEQEEESKLRRQAAFAGITGSEPGKIVVEFIRERLVKRVKELVEDDPEAKAVMELLHDLKIKEALAENAASALIDRYMGKREG